MNSGGKKREKKPNPPGHRWLLSNQFQGRKCDWTVLQGIGWRTLENEKYYLEAQGKREKGGKSA